jgi:hypothetical protein
MGNTLTLSSVHGGSSLKSSSLLSLSIARPVLCAAAGAIHTYGCGAYRTLPRTATLRSSRGKMSNMVLPETNAVVPRGTDSSSAVPSS